MFYNFVRVGNNLVFLCIFKTSEIAQEKFTDNGAPFEFIDPRTLGEYSIQTSLFPFGCNLTTVPSGATVKKVSNDPGSYLLMTDKLDEVLRLARIADDKIIISEYDVDSIGLPEGTTEKIENLLSNPGSSTLEPLDLLGRPKQTKQTSSRLKIHGKWDERTIADDSHEQFVRQQAKTLPISANNFQQYQQIIGQYPSSYFNIYQNMIIDNNQIDCMRDYQCAVKLLKDYSGTIDKENHSPLIKWLLGFRVIAYLASSLNLIFHGHWNRHYTNKIDAIVKPRLPHTIKDYDNFRRSDTLVDLLSHVLDELPEPSEWNLDGSLAKRISYIQGRAKRHGTITRDSIEIEAARQEQIQTAQQIQLNN